MPASMAPVLLPPVVDLSSRLPPCGNQGNAGNCVTWAIVSGCLNLELDAVYGPLGRTPTDESFIPSVRYAYVGARYLYNNQNAPESDPGADALRFLYEYGTPSELDAPTGVGGGHVWGPGDPAWWSSPLLDLSLNRKANLIDLEDHWSIHDGRTPAEGPALLNCIKTIVGRDRRGVAVGFFLNQHNPNQHNSPENPWIYDFTPVDPHDQLSFAGNHEMCVVGYDDNLQVLKLRNSRGPLWGDYDGYVFLSYQNFLNTSMPALPVMNAITIAEDYHSSTAQTYLGLGATEAYPPPNHFRATPGSYPDKVILRWDSLPGAVRYSVYRDNLPNEYMHYTVEDPDAPICIVYDEASSPGTTHTYWVRASFSDGQVGAISRPIYGWASAAGGGI